MWKGFLEMGLYLDMRVNMDSRDLKQLIHLSIYLESIYLSKKKQDVKWNYVLLTSINIVLLNNIFRIKALHFRESQN